MSGDLKFGTISNSPVQTKSQTESPAIRSSTMSGGANPPKNLGQNVPEMRFGDIPVKTGETPPGNTVVAPNNGGAPPAVVSSSSPSTVAATGINTNLANTTSKTETPNRFHHNSNNNHHQNIGSPTVNFHHRPGNYEHRPQHRGTPSQYGQPSPNVGYNNNRGKSNQQQQQQQHYPIPSPQVYSPYIYQPNPYGFYGAPPMIPSQVAYYPPAMAGQAPYVASSPAGGNVTPHQFSSVVDPTKSSGSGSPAAHQSPLPHRSTPVKVHTPIKLSDPVTHQPIELTRASPVSSTTPKASSASLSSPRHVGSDLSSNSAQSSPKESTFATTTTTAATTTTTTSTAAAATTPVLATASTAATSGSAAASLTGSPSPAKTSTDVRFQLKEQIRQRLAEEKIKKEEMIKKQQEEKEKAEAAEREAKEKAEREQREKEEKEEKERQEQEREQERERQLAQEKEQQAKKDKEEKEKLAPEESKAPQNGTITTSTPTSTTNTAAPVTTNASAPISTQSSKLSSATSMAATKALEKASRPSTESLEELTYPQGINRPSTKSTKNRFRYDIPFLMQFQSIVTFPPRENWDSIRSVMSLEPSSGKGYSGGNKSFGNRSGSLRNANMQHNQPAMGSFGAGGSGFRQGDRSVSAASPGFHMGSTSGHRGLNRMSSTTSLNSMSKNARQGSFRKKGGNSSNSDRSGSRGGDNVNAMTTESEKSAVPAAPLVRSANAWVPRARQTEVDGPPSETNRIPPDIVQRKVKSLLNKMTLENFSRVTDQILEIASQSKYEKDGRTLRQVIELTFAKACDEAHWSKMYAQFCAEMTTRVDPEVEDENVKDAKGKPVKGGPLFRKYLLSRCQDEFEVGWSDKLPTNPDGSSIDVTDMMSDEYNQAVIAKRRGLGLIRFIGELFMLNLLSEKIILSCIAKLVGTKDPSEEVIESLCQLVTTVGARLDKSRQMRPFVDFYFEKMLEIQNTPELPSRLRFMLMDVADLRAANWVDKNSDKGPKTLTQIHDEARAKQQAEEAARALSRSNRSNYRSDSRPNNFTMAGDLTRLGRIRSQGPGQATLGPSSMLNRDLSGSNSSRKSASPSLSLSKEGSRTPSQNQKVNIFEHLNDVEDSSDKKTEERQTEENGEGTTTTAEPLDKSVNVSTDTTSENPDSRKNLDAPVKSTESAGDA